MYGASAEYEHALGEAVYSFAYYEWGIAYMVDYLWKLRNPKTCFFWGEPPLYGPKLKRALLDAINGASADGLLTESMCTVLVSVREEYIRLTHVRNSLLHAHPITDERGDQRLNDKNNRWTLERIREATAKFQAAVGHVGRTGLRELVEEKRTRGTS